MCEAQHEDDEVRPLRRLRRMKDLDEGEKDVEPNLEEVVIHCSSPDTICLHVNRILLN